MYGIVDEDYVMSIAMSLFFENKAPKIKFEKRRTITKEGRRVLDQMKEQAEDVEYEEIRN